MSVLSYESYPFEIDINDIPLAKLTRNNSIQLGLQILKKLTNKDMYLESSLDYVNQVWHITFQRLPYEVEDTRYYNLYGGIIFTEWNQNNAAVQNEWFFFMNRKTDHIQLKFWKVYWPIEYVEHEIEQRKTGIWLAPVKDYQSHVTLRESVQIAGFMTVDEQYYFQIPFNSDWLYGRHENIINIRPFNNRFELETEPIEQIYYEYKD